MSAGFVADVPPPPKREHIPELKPATVTLTTGTLTDDEIERIARRVAELIQGRNYQGTVIDGEMARMPKVSQP